MRGPLHFLWNTRLIGTYLRFRVALVFASILAMSGAIVAMGIGGIWGLVVLMGLVVSSIVALGIVLMMR